MRSGVQTSNVNRIIRSTFFAITIHAFIPLLWIVLAVFIVPRFAYGFSKSDFEIPALTGVVVKFSGLMSTYWFLYLFIMALILVADGAIYFTLLRSSGQSPAGLWSIVVILVEGIFTVLCVILLCLPLMKIITRNE